MSRWSYHIPILGYHRVGAFKGDHVPTVSAEAFERQMSCLARWRYRVLDLEQMVAALDGGQRALRRSVVVTFDDGYEETCTVAWPILKRFGFPATVFVASDEVGRPGFVTWDQVTQMANDGLTVGSHTMSHSYLPLLSEDRLSRELLDSKRIIEERIGTAVRFLSYPVGGFTPQAQAIAREAGYLAACTTNRAMPHAGIDRYALRRVKVSERDAHPLVFRAKVSGYYDMFRRLKEPG